MRIFHGLFCDGTNFCRFLLAHGGFINEKILLTPNFYLITGQSFLNFVGIWDDSCGVVLQIWMLKLPQFDYGLMENYIDYEEEDATNESINNGVVGFDKLGDPHNIWRVRENNKYDFECLSSFMHYIYDIIFFYD